MEMVIYYMANPGKNFEQEIIESIKKYNREVADDLYYDKWTDSASGFGMDSGSTRFSLKSPYDIFLYKRDCGLFFLELKSSGGTSISFSEESDKKEIKASQIKSLTRASTYGINAGFLLNFRKYEKTFYLSIQDFLGFVKETEKKSINLDDVENSGGILIPQTRKKVKFWYGINTLFESKDDNNEET